MNVLVRFARTIGIKLVENDPRRQLIALLPELRGFARFLARQPGEADDLVQETVLRALSSLPQFVEGTSLRAWSFTILRNLFYEQARRRRGESRALERAVSLGDSEAGRPVQEARMDLSDLQRQLFVLPPILREALVLVGAQGMSYDEAAIICGVPAGTVKARVSRARRQLAAAMHVGAPARMEE